MPEPLLLRADNFTPASRTPWGGRAIVTRIKPWLAAHEGPVGESWELSVTQELPSLTDEGRLLAEILARDPRAWLGEQTGASLLVKLLDAADELSVQIHPSDDHTGLGEGEGGKPESWYVTHTEPGAVLYVGLAEGVTHSSLREAIARGDDVSKLLGRVPVEPGDFFLIEAGMPHAVGRGVTLVEPQCVSPGKRGLTYRYWDWNRRYDEKGALDAAGVPRVLHVEDALAVTRFDAPRGDALLEHIRLRAGRATLEGEARLERFSGGYEAALRSDALEVSRVIGDGETWLPSEARLRALTVLEGAIAIEGLRVEAGRTAALPASLAGARLTLERAHGVVSATIR